MRIIPIFLLTAFPFILFGQQVSSVSAWSEADAIQKGEAKKKPKTIVFDVTGKSFDERREYLYDVPRYSLNQDELGIVVVKNINLFIYNVKVHEQFNEFFNETKLSEPKDPRSFTINPINYNLSDLNINMNIDKLSDIKDLTEKEQNEIRLLDKQIDSVGKVLNPILEDIDSKDFELRELVVKDTKSKEEQQEIKDLQSQLRKLFAKSSDMKEQIEKMKKKRDALVGEDPQDLELMQDLNRKVDNFKDRIVKLTMLKEYYNSLICNLYSSGKSFDTIDASKDVLTRLYFSDYNNGSFNISYSCYERLRAVQSAYKELINSSDYTYGRLKGYTSKQALKALIQDIAKLNEQIKFSAFEDFFNQIERVYNLYEPSNFELKFYIVNSNDNADKVNYSISATPVNGVPCGGALTKSIEFPQLEVHFKRGWKINVSSGIFANIGLSDNTYRFSKEDGKAFVRENDDKNLFQPSFGFLLHLYKRSYSNTKVGYCFGISTADAQRLKYYAGPSLIFGRNQRLIVSGGVAGGQVNYNSYDFPVNQEVKMSLEELPNAVPLRESAPFRLGGFVSFTFNLSGNSNNQFASTVTGAFKQ